MEAQLLGPLMPTIAPPEMFLPVAPAAGTVVDGLTHPAARMRIVKKTTSRKYGKHLSDFIRMCLIPAHKKRAPI
jgi:hypothetical protein